MRSNSCPKCQGSMAEGFIVDIGQNGRRTVATWVGGTPEKNIWVGIKLGKRLRLEIETWRCGRCGFLENYAKPRKE